ncbi:hypothetical protein E7V67_014860 [[Empedobacter] haloabium]|uniref:Universal stress protein n=1 Tax=[Empedobacter] haloabium TaxID=592317 RepID=A0ABZ1UE44_9BURK
MPRCTKPFCATWPATRAWRRAPDRLRRDGPAGTGARGRGRRGTAPFQRYSGQPGTDLAAWLGRHGVQAEVEVGSANGNTAAALPQAARAGGADLVVAGAYGRNRFRELVAATPRPHYWTMPPLACCWRADGGRGRPTAAPAP